MAKDTREELGRRLLAADADKREQRGAVLNALESIYANPRRAYANMQSFTRDNSDKALLAKLEKDPAYFGPMRGYPGSGNALSLQGMKDRGVARDLAATLPGLVSASLAAENRWLNVQRACHELDLAEGKGGPEKSGPDFPGT